VFWRPVDRGAPVPEGATLAPGLTALEHLSRNRALDVYDVWDGRRQCRCIAKTVRPDRRGDPVVCDRLRQEGALLARLGHPHIVRAYETREKPQLLVLLETLTGETLGHRIETGPRLPVDQLALLGLHVGSALAYLHAEGYLHVDVKPSNVIVDNGLAKLIDLSLARPPGPGRAGMGTADYLSPEQARGEPFTTAVDVWGLGMVLFDAATQELPFPALDGLRHPQAFLSPTPVRVVRPALPAELAAVIDACLQHEPEDRPRIADVLPVLSVFAGG
jgi:eukaryotic-like serine/threonine-protein kinase